MENIKLYNGDCLEVMKNIENNSVDLVVIDPPYKLTSGGRKNTKYKVKEEFEEGMKKGTVFKENEIKYSEWFPEIFRVLKDGTHCYVMCNDKYVNKYLNEAEKVGFKEANILFWNKRMQPPTQYYMKCGEFILMLKKGKARYINNIGSKTLIDIKGLRGSEKLHPTEKPIDLLEHLIGNSTNEGEIVLDCFMGAGSAGIASVKLNRKFIGVELDKNYFDVAKSRIENTYNNQN